MTALPNSANNVLISIHNCLTRDFIVTEQVGFCSFQLRGVNTLDTTLYFNSAVAIKPRGLMETELRRNASAFYLFSVCPIHTGTMTLGRPELRTDETVRKLTSFLFPPSTSTSSSYQVPASINIHRN